MAEQGLINNAVEDALAHATTEQERALVLRAALMVVGGYLREQTGTDATVATLRAVAKHYEEVFGG